MASGPITSWQIDGETMETLTDFMFLGSKITVTAAMKLKDTPWKESYDKCRQHIKKQRHHFAAKTQVCLVKAMVFQVVMSGCDNWTIKKAEGQRKDTFELWCWRRLLRIPGKARRSYQSILRNQS